MVATWLRLGMARKSPTHAARTWRNRCSGHQSRATKPFVFSTTAGTPVDAQNVINRHCKPLLKRAGLPNIRLHDLLHTCATLLRPRGTHPKLVQCLLGHASIQLTLDRYSHWMPSMGRNTAEGMDEALG